MEPDLRDVIFDQYSRYRSSSELLEAVCGADDTLLDVGSGPECLLGRFLPDHSITYVDPLLASSDAGADGSERHGLALDRAELGAEGFDYVVCVDTLEHVPPEERAGFLDHLSRLARKGVLVACPCHDAGAAREVDARINQVYQGKTGREYPWLEEHRRYGLPGRGQIVRQFQDAGWRLHGFENGRAVWLEELLAWILCLLDHPAARSLVRELSRFFNDHLYRFDHLGPCYRQLLLLTRENVTCDPGWLPDTPELRREAEERWSELRIRIYDHLTRPFAEDPSGAAARAEEELRNRDEKLRDRERELRDRDEELRDRERELRDKDEELRDKDEELRDKDEELRDRDEALQRVKQGFESRIEELSRRSQELRKEVELHHQASIFLKGQLDAREASRSWRITAPLRFAAGVTRRGSRRAHGLLSRCVGGVCRPIYRRLPVSPEIRWQLKHQLFRWCGPLLRGTHAWAAYEQELIWRDGRQLQLRASDPAWPSPPGRTHPDADDILVWGVIDWHFRIQRPQHLAMGLAKRGHRVFYISPQFVESTEAGFDLERLDVEGVIYLVRLHTRDIRVLYSEELKGETASRILSAIELFLRWAGLGRVLSLVDQPAWFNFASVIPDSRLAYDCMDHHAGFGSGGPWLQRLEDQLFSHADLVVTSSDALKQQALRHTPRTVLIRNACEHEHFARRPGNVFSDPRGRRVIGYYGAVAEWFDVELVRAVALRFPEHLILLVGADTVGCASSLAGCENVQGVGEVPYDRLPGFLHGMDVCLIPFLINDLTLATNPVKVYEYLSAAKPIVTTDLPELRADELDRLIYRTTSRDGFLEAVRRALVESSSDPILRERIEYSAGQTWDDRSDELERAVKEIADPLVSIVMITHNNLELTRRCVDSLERDSSYRNRELIVVDNASSDDTPRYLEEIAARSENVEVVLNQENRGFAAANNQGLAIASGEFLTLLNNDTLVTPGWIRTLVGRLKRDPTIGIIGPITNNIGNEARVSTRYSDPAEMPGEAYQLTRARVGQSFDIPVVAFFCVMFPRGLYEQLGPLDEQFGMGFFEDDDYCERARRAGRRVVCAEDVFVHHELSASFDQVKEAERRALFERNRAYFESKWGPWKPHAYRTEVSGPA